MRIVVRLDLSAPLVGIEETDNAQRFDVIIVGGNFRTAARAIEPYGRLIDEDTAVLKPRAIWDLCSKTDHALSLVAFDTLLFHAGEAGWLDGPIPGLRAHCRWATSAGWGTQAAGSWPSTR